MGNDANGTGSEGPERPQQIRNVVLVGSASSGKTSLFERLVTARTPGRHSRGEPVASTSLRAASVTSGPIHVNLVDTPGHPDFVGEVRAGLRAADAVLFVVSACDEIDEATRLLWRECAVAGMPRAVAVTKLEQARADFDETVARCQRAFGGAQPADIPLLSGRSLARLVNLLRRTVTDYRDGTPTVRGPDAEEAALIEERRGPLMESIIEESEDEVLLERHLNGEDIEFEMVATDLRAAIATARFFPVVATHAPSGMGIEELYELFEHGFPPPDAAALPAVQTASGEDFGPLTCDPDGPLVAEVVRTTSAPSAAGLSLVGVFSGRLRPDTPLHVSGHLQRFAAHLNVGHPDHDSDDERAGPLAAPLGEETRPKPQAIAGDLVLVSKLTAAETPQLVLWTMGPAHVDKLLTALRESWRVGVEVEPVRTSLRETFLRPTTVQGRLVKQSGGHGQYAVCQMEIEPLERGAGVQFAERVVGGAVPRQFIPSVEKGIRNQMSKGVLAGYPMVDVRVTLVDGKAHSVNSSDMAFQTAAASGLREAANESTVALLEPIDAVDITVAEDSVGSVLADLRSRRGQVHGTEAAPQPGYIVVHAEIPAHELSRYPIDLRSVSHGTGSFTRRFVRYDYLPAALARELTSA